MQEADNTRVVQEAYAAFGRGDIQGILNTLHDDILWKPVYGAASYVPTAGERRGKASVKQFFELVAQSMTFDQFEPREFVAQGNAVVALGHYRGRAKNGGQFESDWVMVFAFRGNKIVQFQEFTDSAALNAAFMTVAAAS
jgi:ketosteroid isomerase-like protein